MTTLMPSGSRVLSSRDLVRHLGSTETWWEKHRKRLVKANLLVKAGKRFVGDLTKIQAAIAEPAFWADEPAPHGEPGSEVAASREPK
jgi:hypothetical protein